MRVGIYTGVHKGMRNLVTRFAFRVGTVDWMQADEVTQAAHEWQTVHWLIDGHHRNEERYLHPLLAQAIPGGRRPYDEEHRAFAIMLDDLSGHLDRLVKDGAVANRPLVGLEFYRGVNRFYADFLAHLHREETQAERALNELYPPEALTATFVELLAAIPPDEVMLDIDYMFPAMSLPEAAEFLASAHLPPEAFDRLAARVRQAVGEADWARLQALLAAQPAPVG